MVFHTRGMEQTCGASLDKVSCLYWDGTCAVEDLSSDAEKQGKGVDGEEVWFCWAEGLQEAGSLHRADRGLNKVVCLFTI